MTLKVLTFMSISVTWYTSNQTPKVAEAHFLCECRLSFCALILSKAMICFGLFAVAFVVNSLFWLETAPCGISTHIEIAHRAVEHFSHNEGRYNYRELLQKHPEAFQAGSVYPDAFYQDICMKGTYHALSEDSHWAPFLKTSLNYVRKVYPRPWNEGAQKLVAFLFGIASHMVTDVSWHSLDIDQGFLRAMGEIDFRGSYTDAHHVGDFGGDVLSQFEFDFGYLESKWYIPVWDLVNIYKEFYGTDVIEEGPIIDCTYILFLQMYGESIAVSKLFSTYAKKSPFLVERFHDYFLGGIDDMTFWSTNIFQLTAFMLDNGTSNCYIPENPIFIQCDGQKKHTRPGRIRFQKDDSNQNTSLSIITSVGAHVNRVDTGVLFQINSWAKDPMQMLTNATRSMNLRGLFNQNDQSDNSSPSAVYFVTSPYARLGRSTITADLNQDGLVDLIVGAPGYSTFGQVQVGRVYVIYSNETGLPSTNLDLDKDADVLLQGLEGSVYVYFGSNGFSNTPNITIRCRFTYCNLGWTLLTADMNGDGKDDLVIGSPYAPGGGKQRGVVSAFYSHRHRSRRGRLSIEESDWSARGEHNYAWFGYALHGHKFNSSTLLLVGSPTWSNCKSNQCDDPGSSSQSQGKVYGFYPPSITVSFVLQGDTAQTKLGSSFATGTLSINGIGKSVLLIGAPTQDSNSRLSFISQALHHAGAVKVYEISAGTAPSSLGTLSGDRQFSRFGASLHMRDLDNDGLDEIFVASPLETEDLKSMLFGSHAGHVYIYNGNITSPGLLSKRCKSWFQPCPGDWAQYVLISPEGKTSFGTAVTTVMTREKKQVVIAAEKGSRNARFAGTVYLYNLG
uniref:Phosphatidylinositol-glycan-specific phospholipase D n=1 Tax=Leptobrachium leishanense TaxID=445787 RepID=A0A8C5N0I5_9ANUR